MPGLPKASWVSWVEAGRFDAGDGVRHVRSPHLRRHDAVGLQRPTDFGKTWTRIVGAEQGVRGYAHVIKEDPVEPAAPLPRHRVRSVDLARRRRELGAVQGRRLPERRRARSAGPSARQRSRDRDARPRHLDHRRHRRRCARSRGDMLAEAGGVPAGAAGAAADAGATAAGPRATRRSSARIRRPARSSPTTSARATSSGRSSSRSSTTRASCVDTLAADQAPRHQPRRLVDAGQAAARAARGAGRVRLVARPRVVPGTYTVRLTQGSDVIETKLVVGLDRRAPYNAADRKAQFDAAMRAHALFDEMSARRSHRRRARRRSRSARRRCRRAIRCAAKLAAVAREARRTRKKIVATKEGGAITGEERIREHLDDLYGALAGWEGRPAKYQVIDRRARKELGDAEQGVRRARREGRPRARWRAPAAQAPAGPARQRARGIEGELDAVAHRMR